MQKVAEFVARNLVSLLGITVLTGATVTTSVMGVAKVADTFRQAKLAVPDQKTDELISPLPSPTATASANILGTSTTLIFKTVGGTTLSTASSSSQAEAPKAAPSITSSPAPTGPQNPGNGTGRKDKRPSRNQDQAQEQRIHQE